VIEVGKGAFEGFSDDRCKLPVQKTWDLKGFTLDVAFSRGYDNFHRRLDELTSKSRLQEGLVKPLILAMSIKTNEVS
jgi:hypothetical protein